MKKKLCTCLAAALAGVTLLAGCAGINKNATLVTINGGEDTISLGYGNFEARMAQAQYDMVYRLYYGDTFWSTEFTDGTMESSVKEEILEGLEDEYVLNRNASEYGIFLSDDQKSAISTAVAEFMEENTKEGLAQLGATKELAEEYLTNRTVAMLVDDAIRSETEVELDPADYTAKAYTYVFFNLNGHYDDTYTNWVTLSEEEQEQLAVDAQTLADADPEEFQDMANELGQSLLKQTYTPQDLGSDSYTLDQAVLEAAETLSEGEISDVIEVEDTGYYVIRMDSLNDEDATAEALADAEDDLRQAHYDEVVDAWKEAIIWEVNEDAWAQVRFDDLFEEMEHTHEGDEEAAGAETAADESADESDDESAVDLAEEAENETDTAEDETADGADASEDTDTSENTGAKGEGAAE